MPEESRTPLLLVVMLLAAVLLAAVLLAAMLWLRCFWLRCFWLRCPGRANRTGLQTALATSDACTFR